MFYKDDNNNIVFEFFFMALYFELFAFLVQQLKVCAEWSVVDIQRIWQARASLK